MDIDRESGVEDEMIRGGHPGKKRQSKGAFPRPIYGSSWAFVVGINKYKTADGAPLQLTSGGDQFDDLKNAVNDAKAVANLLRERFEFNVHELYDEHATSSNILDWLRDWVPKQSEVNDRLIFFFAGHGTTQSGTHGSAAGFLLPSGATTYGQAISMGALFEICNGISAKHIFIVLDCCFSGAAAVTGSYLAKQIRPRCSGYLDSITSKSAWQILTAGQADEPAADSGRESGHSAFTAALLDGLNNAADTDNNGLITASALARYVQKKVTDELAAYHLPMQQPVYRHLLNGAAGDFVFLTPERRLRDHISQELIEIMHKFKIEQHLIARVYQTIVATARYVDRDNGLEPVSELIYCLEELWELQSAPGQSSSILEFGARLAKYCPDCEAAITAWRERALAQELLGLQWQPQTLTSNMTGLSETSHTSLAFLTVILIPIDASPHGSPLQKTYNVNVFFWETETYVIQDKTYNLSELEQKINGLLDRIARKYPHVITNLAVEFYLPFELISWKFEAWPRKKAIMGGTRLGIDHPVLVRCIDRTKDSDACARWQHKWRCFKHGMPNAGGQKTFAIYYCREYRHHDIYNNYSDSSVHCLAVTSMVSGKIGEPSPLTEIMAAGIPIAVWPRPEQASLIDEEIAFRAFEEMLHDGEVVKLPNRIQNARRQANLETDLGHHLTLLWDDYDRIPDLLQQGDAQGEAFEDFNL